MHRGAYNFTVDRNKSLADEAERAVNRIYTAGLMFRGGKLSAGGNNVMADSAAEAFSAGELLQLKGAGEPRQTLCAEIIGLRQDFAALGNNADGVQQDKLLQQIYGKAQELKAKGWTPSSEPHRVGMTGFAAPRP
jgi:hypothetical protein